MHLWGLNRNENIRGVQLIHPFAFVLARRMIVYISTLTYLERMQYCIVQAEHSMKHVSFVCFDYYYFFVYFVVENLNYRSMKWILSLFELFLLFKYFHSWRNMSVLWLMEILDFSFRSPIWIKLINMMRPPHMQHMNQMLPQTANHHMSNMSQHQQPHMNMSTQQHSHMMHNHQNYHQNR